MSLAEFRKKKKTFFGIPKFSDISVKFLSKVSKMWLQALHGSYSKGKSGNLKVPRCKS